MRLQFPHTASPYVRWELNKLKYNERNTSGVHKLRILYIIPSDLDNFLLSSCVWNFHDSRLSSIIPRYFIFGDSNNLTPFSFSVTRSESDFLEDEI